MIAHSQVGYAPAARKIAYVECGTHAGAPGIVRLLRVGADGALTEAHAAPAERWGEYLRYIHYTFDFSSVREPGLYVLEADGVRTHAFRIAGGIVPGVLVLKPDFPENKKDWPFLWGENEYVVNLAGNYIFLVHAADELVRAAE